MKRFTILILTIMGLFVLNAMAQQANREQRDNGFMNNLFPPDLVMRFANDINLSDKQKNDIKEAIKTTESNAIDIRWDMREEAEHLIRLSSGTSLDAGELLAQADKVMTLEKDVKLAQLGLLIEIKNILNPDQQEQLQQLRPQGGSGVGAARRLNNPNIRN